VITRSPKVDGLRIASRTSLRPEGKAADIARSARLPGVSAVLEGTVRKLGDRLRITAQLAAAEDGRALWSERYDRTLDDVFAIQDEIARTIVIRCAPRSWPTSPTLRRSATPTTRAYSLYLKGATAGTAQPGGVLESISFFKQAIDHDPDYALAYSGLSDAYALQVDYRSVPVTEGTAGARIRTQALALVMRVLAPRPPVGTWDTERPGTRSARATGLWSTAPLVLLLVTQRPADEGQHEALARRAAGIDSGRGVYIGSRNAGTRLAGPCAEHRADP